MYSHWHLHESVNIELTHHRTSCLEGQSPHSGNTGWWGFKRVYLMPPSVTLTREWFKTSLSQNPTADNKVSRRTGPPLLSWTLPKSVSQLQGEASIGRRPHDISSLALQTRLIKSRQRHQVLRVEQRWGHPLAHWIKPLLAGIQSRTLPLHHAVAHFYRGSWISAKRISLKGKSSFH